MLFKNISDESITINGITYAPGDTLEIPDYSPIPVEHFIANKKLEKVEAFLANPPKETFKVTFKNLEKEPEDLEECDEELT